MADLDRAMDNLGDRAAVAFGAFESKLAEDDAKLIRGG